MISEPPIVKESLISVLEREYGFVITNISFLSQGECSWGYLVTTKNEEKFYLKIPINKHVDIKRLRFIVDLQNKCGLSNVVAPILTNNDSLTIVIDSYSAILFPFISGETAMDKKLNEEQLYAIGQLLAQLHKSSVIIGEFFIKEDFVIPFENDFSKVMDEIKKDDVERDEFGNELIFLYKTHNQSPVNEYQNLLRLQSICRKEFLDFVNCHGDPNPANIILTSDKKIFLVDWDDLITAPKEKDLLFWSGAGTTFIEGYKNVAGEVAINQTAKDFYSCFWNAQEIADFGTRLLFEEDTVEQRAHHLEKLRGHLHEMGIT